MKNVILGTLAHVDAGKTTLSESMLYKTGSIRHIGRVDHKDTFLDYDEQERSRGITIYAKQAMLSWNDTNITLMDTPGHVDFSAEMERTLQILDYAMIVISALDGVQAHTETIWNLLKHYQIPTFIFINKMDIAHYDEATLMKEIETKLSGACVNFTNHDDAWYEQIAQHDEGLIEEFLREGNLSQIAIQKAITDRMIFPCFFGSALKMEGIETLLDDIASYTIEQPYAKGFGARVYKITRDEQGNKLTHMKITGGVLKAKEKLSEQEKVDQIRMYSGNKFQAVNEVEAGQVCAIKGLKHIIVGEGLGFEKEIQHPVLSSYLNYKVILPTHCDVNSMYKNFQILAEEDPQLCVRYVETQQSITIQLMGEIQIEVLKNKIKERFFVDVDFDQGSVVYKETITQTVEGVGHYEPLRHYAEVHLLLEPLARNAGLVFETDCSQDILPQQWIRLVLTHLQEKEHLGVLCGAPITDMKITLVSGKAHLKHTEGGDFRQATYRAIRQGLKETSSILLEPFYQFRLHIERTYLSRAMHDLQMRNATFTMEEDANGMVRIHGRAPVATMQNYQLELHAYTKGKGTLFCSLDGYDVCEQSADVIKEKNYDSERDLDNPTGSIFCAHGAGFYVPWNEVKQYMHLKASWKPPITQSKETNRGNKIHIDDSEVERVMRMTYGAPKARVKEKRVELDKQSRIVKATKPQCFIVDGYNIIHDWSSLKEVAKDNLDAARDRLIHYMSSFQGYKKCVLILVFDAYKVPEGIQKEYYNGSIYIVFTKHAQTADSYIEKTTHDMADNYMITVATSDALEQLVVSAQGARRMSARELENEYRYCSETTNKAYESRQSQVGNRALEDLRKLND